MKSVEPRKILLVRLSSLGDVALGTSMPLIVKRLFPAASVSFLTKRPYAELLGHNPALSSVIALDDRHVSMAGFTRLAFELRRERFDTVIDLQGNPRSLALRAVLSPETWLGSRRDGLSRHGMVWWRGLGVKPPRHAVQRYFHALERLAGPVEAMRPKIFLSSEEVEWAGSKVRRVFEGAGDASRRTVGFCPGARWKTKIWSPEKAGLLAKQLAEGGLNVLVLWGPPDEAVTGELRRLCSGTDGIRFLSGTLRELASVMRLCECVVSNDSGLMHVAHSVGTPVVALFGSTVPEFGFYPPDSASVVISKTFSCKPCDVHGKHGCRRKDFRCLESIEVSEVLEAVQGVLQGGRRATRGESNLMESPTFLVQSGESRFGRNAWSLPATGTVAVRLPNWIGDAAMAWPSLAGLERCAGRARVLGVAHPRVAGLFESNPFLDELVVLRDRGVSALLRTARELRRRRCAAGIVMPDSFSSAMLFWLGGVRQSVGYGAELRAPLLARSLTKNRWEHLSLQYAGLLPAGCEAAHGFSLEPSRSHLEAVTRLLGEAGIARSARLALVSPGASYGETKRWPEERFAGLARLLREKPEFEVGLVGGNGERELCSRIARAGARRVTDLSGRTSLGELVALSSLAAVFVGNDSGAAHVAASSGCPAVVIFGSSDPLWTTPLGPRVRVMYRRVSCSPCFRRKCPYHLECLTGIEAGDVHGAVVGVWRETGPGPGGGGS
ncbi:MAG: lipopolysaccharide heptosyltransferase II [Candidatus Eisenbacteria bacterium]